MKKFDFRKFRIRPVRIEELNDRLLLLNLYITQAMTLAVGLIVLAFQGRLHWRLLEWPSGHTVWLWGILFAGGVLLADLLLSRWVPEEYADDGGINRMLFRTRPVWHIALICLIVSICEEVLFRGAIQHAWGPYWTSILFAFIHVRYLRHWLLTGVVFATSYGLGWMYETTGSLWAPIAAHMLIDLIMGLIIRFRKEEEDVGEQRESP